jgi:hypothetical protein
MAYNKSSNKGLNTNSLLGTGTKSFDSAMFEGSETKARPETSTYNYTSKDPIFQIPKVPELTKVPDPKPPRKAPLAGYDMRTLRKQIDYLQSEIDDRTETQQLLYTQNEELWGYSRSLLECNKSNALLMRKQVKALHDELRQLHQERLLLAEKLENAEHSKEMLLKMGVELSGARGAVTTAQRMALDAEDALTRTKRENDYLELTLSDQVLNARRSTVPLLSECCAVLCCAVLCCTVLYLSHIVCINENFILSGEDVDCGEEHLGGRNAQL